MDLIGKTLGHCKIERMLGQGGMGAVYLARHTTLDKEVAIKIIAPQYADNGMVVQRMLREAKLAAKLEHPNVVQIHDAAAEDGIPYIVMQFVDGRSLQEIMSEKKRLTPKEALTITRRVAMALSAAHKLGIIHRDIKPANVLMSKDGKIKVADFGLARSAEPTEAALTTKDVIVGTPQYMSPEQARGESVDGRSDIYSLGATLYCMLTGAPPFDGASAMALAIKHADSNIRIDDPRTRVKDLPESVSSLVLKMMAKPAEQRFQNADELIKSIDAIIQPPPTQRQTAPPKKSRKRVIFLVVGILLGLFLVGQLTKASPAEKLFREAESIQDLDKAMYKHREVIEKFPQTEWSRKSEARLKALTAQKEQGAFDAAAAFWKKNPTQYVEARKGYQRFLEEFPSSKHVASIQTVLKEIAVAEIRSKCEEIERCFKNEPGEIVKYVDPEAVQKQGEVNVRRALEGRFNLAKTFGWEVDELVVKDIRMDGGLAEVDVDFMMKSRRNGEKRTNTDLFGWVLRNNAWYIDPDKMKKRPPK